MLSLWNELAGSGGQDLVTAIRKKEQQLTPSRENAFSTLRIKQCGWLWKAVGIASRIGR